jgi:long-subunit fatty acid transport protein
MGLYKTASSSGVPRWLVAVCVLGVGVIPIAQAALTENIAADPSAMAMGNAVTADPPGVMSIHFNPAGLTRMTAPRTKSDNFAFVSVKMRESFNSAPDTNIGGFKASDDPLNGTSSKPTRHRLYLPGYGLLPWHPPMLVAPGMGFTWHQEGSPFTFGVANYPSMATTQDRSSDELNPSVYQGRIAHIQRLVLAAPAVGYKYSDTLSFGIAAPIAHHAMYINTDMRMPNKLLGTIGQLQKAVCPGGNGQVFDTLTFGLCGGGPEGMLNPFKRAASLTLDITAPIDPTVNVGVLWEPKSWFAVGATFQGGSRTIFRGTFKFEADPMMRNFVAGIHRSLLGPVIAATTGMPSYIPEVQQGNMIATIPFPDRFQMGFKIKPTQKLQVNLDVSYTDWAKMKTMTLKFDQDLELLKMARIFGISKSNELTMNTGMTNVWNWGMGVQYQVTDRFALRMGYEPRKSSIPADQISVLTPLADSTVKSLGFQYKLRAKEFSTGTVFNVTASYMKGNYNVPARTDCNLNCDHFFNIVYNPYAAMDVAGQTAIRYLGVGFSHEF